MVCNLYFPCLLVIYNPNGLCTLCKIAALKELAIADVGEKTTVYQNQISIGLLNFWPIINDLQDYSGSSNLTTGPLDAGETIGFAQDRYKNTNGAIYTNPGYYIISGGLDFHLKFSFLIWVKAFNFAFWSRVLDCGNGPDADNIVAGFANTNPNRPYAQIYQGNATGGIVTVANSLQTNTWFHYAFVFDGQTTMLYVNGSLVASAAKKPPNMLKRMKCYIGRSNFHVNNGDPDASGCFDDVMLYSRALTQDEIRNRMNMIYLLKDFY